MPDFLPDLPVEAILASLARAPGNALKSGKFDGPESSQALVANAFGWFLHRPEALPPLPGVPSSRVEQVSLQAEMRYPWSGGRHPWLDVGVMTHTTLIGVVAKRYEPFRPGKHSDFAEIPAQADWGPGMARYRQLQRDLQAGAGFAALDAVQLVKAAYGLRTRAEKAARGAVLVYLYAEPPAWASGKPVDPALIARHRLEVARFGKAVAGDTVVFAGLRWGDQLAQWAGVPALAAHVAALQTRFGPLQP
ncbi:hypothetical protein [Rhodobacter ferrooxidans]|uniref:Uncharacterized protein n=1 Tax=Rhodobacter ferrooxidans TaxID=371731 RepID=C8S2T8_9RHOB|nr:hypothetical protein [Rhodobacter sp. SW2]EEW24764.1 conserved hypothetical protein [Rhodobacter sp. SW2]